MMKPGGQENLPPGNVLACPDFHLTMEEDDLSGIEAAGPWIVHGHASNRLQPGTGQLIE